MDFLSIDKRLLILSILCPVVYLASPAVRAEPFIKPLDDDSHKFHTRHLDFSSSLSEAGQRMRLESDHSSMQQAQRHQADQRTIQEGTQAMAQQASYANQTQAGVNPQIQSQMGLGGFFAANGIIAQPMKQPLLPSANLQMNQNGNSVEAQIQETGIRSPESSIHEIHGSNTQTLDPFSSFKLPGINSQKTPLFPSSTDTLK